MMSKKIELGQFFTNSDVWLKPQIKDFILNSKSKVAYDPFAGGGDLLNVAINKLNITEVKGLDIDKSLNWEYNNSLLNIPSIENAIIITNPPYIAKNSATRKKIVLDKYFNLSTYGDVYLIALDNMLKAQKNVVAIIPEAFINSSFKKKNYLNSITVLEENPFKDTETPVCVVCFDSIYKTLDRVKVYKNETYLNNLQAIMAIRKEPENSIDIRFNDLNGWLGLRAIDSSNDLDFIKFDYKENIPYEWENKTKVSSRNFSLINIDIPVCKRGEFIDRCNKTLQKIRNESADIILTPFKGNTKKGKRRRRLDFKLARAIMEMAYNDILEVK